MIKDTVSSDYLFETSWEVCNKVGGIHTVIATKVPEMIEKYGENYILIGPDVWRDGEKFNPEFSGDSSILSEWSMQAIADGLNIKVGRWNIPGSPVVVLVDYTPFIASKDHIFSKFWEAYKLDSISGQWDYIESALFGYAAGKVVESFVRYNLSYKSKVVAHFHEWMTGMGVLYLKLTTPQVATAFTTHATVLGRSIAGNGQPLYGSLTDYDPEIKAKEFNVVAKHSLERNAALESDVFTTVSEITARECRQFLGREVDLVTPNGFDDSFIPKKDEFEGKRAAARAKLFEVAKNLTGQEPDENALLVAVSGRYEYRNKGLDAFIKAMGELNRSGVQKKIIAFLLIPANNYGPRKDLLQRLSGEDSPITDNRILTHHLHYIEHDPIAREAFAQGIYNNVGSNVKLIFVPSYLNGNDGIFNMEYYNLLIGMDITVFPSYYEPWGYTPLESIAFHIPTVTTSLAGFGMWVRNHCTEQCDSVVVLDRTDGNDNEIVEGIVNTLNHFSSLSIKQVNEYRTRAFAMSRIALWKNFVSFYHDAYEIALQKVASRAHQIAEVAPLEFTQRRSPLTENAIPEWKKAFVEKNIPKGLSGLEELANNLWWSWNPDACAMFESIEPVLWNECEGNATRFLEVVSYKTLLEAEKNDSFMKSYTETLKAFHDYMKEPKPVNKKIAYFSMEYGIHDSLKIYSGGLGILAGDYMKEASDCNVDMIGIGLLYRHGYFKQEISVSGEQVATYVPQKFSQVPANPVRGEDGWIKTIRIDLPGRNVYARIWKVNVGRIPLYLLDTDHSGNQEADRAITHQLYGGDNENRFKQEMILGVGGIRMLSALGIKPSIYHINEGHAAFCGLERLRRLIHNRKLTFPEAKEIIRASTLFTTHTPVAAGHDAFEENMLRTYMGHYPGRLNITWDEFLALGKADPTNREEKFSMSFLASHLAQEVNGVSMLHGEVTKDLFRNFWPGYFPSELPIGYVTNGVHYPSWTANRWRDLYEQNFGKDFMSAQSDKTHWRKIHEISDETIWDIRQTQRAELIAYVRERYRKNRIRNHVNPKQIMNVTQKLQEKALTIGFARRFATYKRAHLLFRNLTRLSSILNNKERPVQFLFAGKAHPNDKAGQDLIKYIVEISQREEFAGKIIFLENYDIDLAKKMVQGVDIWMNTPTRPLEASGTSGMKAIMNGALHFSVLDGWWVEGYKPGAGWALQEERTYENQEFQNELDSEIIYGLLENDVVPTFYKRDASGIPTEWVQYIKKSIAEIVPEFTTKRMLDDYIERFYNGLFVSNKQMRKDDYRFVNELTSWKKIVTRAWEGIRVVRTDIPDPLGTLYKVGESQVFEVEIFLNGLSEDDIGVEVVLADISESGQILSVESKLFELVQAKNNKALFRTEIQPVKPGVLNYGIRLFPFNEHMAHRQDLCLVKWIQ